jgi:hypothetical protein
MPRGDGTSPGGATVLEQREAQERGNSASENGWLQGQCRTRRRMHVSRIKNDYSSRSRDALLVREMPTMRFTDGKKTGDIYSEGGSNESSG